MMAGWLTYSAAIGRASRASAVAITAASAMVLPRPSQVARRASPGCPAPSQ